MYVRSATVVYAFHAFFFSMKLTVYCKLLMRTHRYLLILPKALTNFPKKPYTNTVKTCYNPCRRFSMLRQDFARATMTRQWSRSTAVEFVKLFKQARLTKTRFDLIVANSQNAQWRCKYSIFLSTNFPYVKHFLKFWIHLLVWAISGHAASRISAEILQIFYATPYASQQSKKIFDVPN